MTNNDAYFNRISSIAEKRKLFDGVIKAKMSLVGQSKDKHKIIFKAEEFDGDKVVLSMKQGKEIFKDGDDAILSFDFQGDKYFLKTSLEKRIDLRWGFGLVTDVYRLQRRENFRIELPRGSSARFLIKSVNDQSIERDFEIADVSSGGLAIEMPPGHELPFQSGQTVRGIIHITNKLNQAVTGLIRNVRNVKEYKVVRVGIEFQNLTAAEEQAIQKTVLDLHREIFSKYKD